jgi:hypothetical protein
MLDDVAAFLIVAPVASSLLLVALLGVWLLGGRGLGPRRAARRVTLIETEAPVRGKT